MPATAAWQRAKLAGVLRELAADPEKPGIEPPARQAAIADLRYLATPDAVAVMAQHLRDDEPSLIFECGLGLVGLPERLWPAALDALNARMDAPDFPVSGWLLEAMSVLEMSGPPTADSWKQRLQLRDANWELALRAFPEKKGKARGATLQTLVSQQPAHISAQQKEELSRALAADLMDETPEQQAASLQYQWDMLRSGNAPGDILPALKEMAAVPLKDPESRDRNCYAVRQLKSIALQRWFELDPVGAHEEALRQIGSANPSLTPEALAFLPPEKLPQFEGTWADEFMAAKDDERETLFASLLARFGDGSAVAAVEAKANAIIGERPWGAEGPALGYLVKFDPEGALPLVERAVSSGQNGGVFQSIAQYGTDPVLTKAAIEALDNPKPEVVMDALIYLMGYGDASAKEPIWNRYVEWSEKWRGRADVLEGRKAGSEGNWEERGLGEALARALIANQGWLADSDSIARVLERCVGEQMCAQMKQVADRANAEPFPVTEFRSAQAENYEVAQYEAKSLELLDAKIAQFPRGTRFVLAQSPATQDERDLNEQVKAIFEKHGMTLQQPPAVQAP